jgi:hypothetical protein
MDIGSLHTVFTPDFYESHEFARNVYTNKYGSNNWVFWPAEYSRERDNDFQGILGAAGLYLALTDFYDKDSQFHSHYNVAVWGDRGPHGERSGIKIAYTPDILSEQRSWRYRKWPDPVVTVDNITRTREARDKVDPNLIAEMMIETVVHSDIGITITRKAYGWSQGDNDDYIIVEFYLQNSGYIMEYNPDSDRYNRTVRPSGWPQLLNDVWFALCFRWQPSALGCIHNGNWQDNLLGEKGHDAQHIYLGETYGQVNQKSEDSLRALISWDGDADAVAIEYDDTGNPHVLTGVLLSPQYVGVSIIHADEIAHQSNSTVLNDPKQPKTTMWRGSYKGKYAFNQTEWKPSDSTVYNYISSGNHQENAEVGGESNGGLDNLAEENGYFLGFGPYNFQPNDVVRIVTAFAAGGISRHGAIEVGKQWQKNKDNHKKNEILASGRDSLLINFHKAELMYVQTNSLTIVPETIMPPPPPETFTAQSEIGQVLLEWDGSLPESVPDFAGYRLYRNYRPRLPINHPANPADTLYQKIWECGVGTDNPDIVSSYIDSNIKPLWNYRYYLTTYDLKGNESGPFYTLFETNARARPSWYINVDEPLSDVMVIPNPAIYKARGWAGDRIMFVNLPSRCTIRIYTQSGNLVQVIEHPRPGENEDGDEYWNQETMANQNVTSGGYIYTVESNQGTAVGTLLIIR